MKFRTDFVTNSSSSSYIAMKVITADQTITGALESPNDVSGKMKGFFDITEAELNDASDFRPILTKMVHWFDATQDVLGLLCLDDFEPAESDPELEDEEEETEYGTRKLSWEECEHVLKSCAPFGQTDLLSLLSVDMRDVQTISFFSRMECSDEPWGASLIEYDRVSKQMKITRREPDYNIEDDEKWQEYNYGLDLEERFRNDFEDQRITADADTGSPEGARYNKYNWKDAVIPEGYQMCSACYDVYPQHEMVLHEVRGVRYPFCPACSKDFFS